MREILIGSAGSGKTTTCVRECLSAMADKREVVCLLPNRDEAAQMRRRLLAAANGRALFLPGIVTFRSLLRQVMRALDSRLTLRPPFARRLHLRGLLAQAQLGPLSASGGTQGFLNILDRLFSELDDGDVRGEDLVTLAAGLKDGTDKKRLNILASLHQDYVLEQEDSFTLDQGRALARCAAWLEDDPARASSVFPDNPLFVIDGFSNLTPLQLRFLKAVLPPSADALFSMCMQPSDLDGSPRPPFERLHRLAIQLLRMGWQRRDLVESHRHESEMLSRLATGLFRVEPGQGGGNWEEELTCIIGATRRDEVDGIQRELRREISGGTDPAELAVLFRDPAYGELLSRSLAAAGIPFQASIRLDLSREPVVDLVLSLLGWAGGDTLIRNLPQRLRGGYVATDDGLLADLQSISRSQGLPRRGDWSDYFRDKQKTETAADWDWLSWQQALPSGQLTARAFFDEVLSPLLSLLDANLSRRFAAKWRERGNPFAETAIDRPALEALRGVASCLAADFGDKKMSLSGWQDLLRESLEGETIARQTGSVGGGVLLGNPFDIRLPEVKVAFVCGLNQGSFPPAFRDHPLLSEGERQKLNETFAKRSSFARLREWKDRQAEERYLFYISCTRPSRRLVLTHSLRDAKGKTIPASFYLDEVERLGDCLPEPVDVPARSMGGKLVDPISPRDLLRDVLFAQSRREIHPLCAPATDFLDDNGFADMIAEFSRPRSEAALAGHQALLRHVAKRTSFGVTGLERYAACPYAFLADRILGLEVDRVFEASAADRGNLLHKALEMFYLSEWNGGFDPEQVAADKMEDLLLRACGELARQPVFASPRLRVELPLLAHKLSRFLRNDLDRLEKHGHRPDPKRLEKRLQLKGKDLPGTGAEDFTIVGKADRVDLIGDESLLVIDYKSGLQENEPWNAKKPTLIQLALYALAQDRHVSGATYCSLGAKKPLRGCFRVDMEPAISPWGAKSHKGCQFLTAQEWTEWLLHRGQLARDIVAGIRNGDFPVRPDDEEKCCKYCQMRQLCRWDPAAAPAKKKGGRP